MNKHLAALMTLLALLGCGRQEGAPPAVETGGGSEYAVLGEDLALFRESFNATKDKLRLVFIGGPACGICLRGMDDLNRAIVASLQNDPRVHTFMLEVPALGSTEKHAIDAMRLLPGPRVSHYWDEEGTSGLKFQEALEIPMYAWDVWMIYEPGAVWEADFPPPPDFWQHQLGSLAKDKHLDAEVFANEVRLRLKELPKADASIEAEPLVDTNDDLFRVEQPRGYIISQNHKTRGGYRHIKRLKAVYYRGQTEANGQQYQLLVETGRPSRYRRELRMGTERFVASWDGDSLMLDGSAVALPTEILEKLLTSFDFDGWMTEWKDKGHKIWRLGMKKDAGRLPWVMEAELSNGGTWLIYVDSHTGDIYRHILVDDGGEGTLSIEFDDFREVDGFRLPHEVRYYDSGRLLATDRFTEVEVETGKGLEQTGN